MKTTTFTILLLLTFCHWLAAQCPTDAYFSTQAEIDDFPIQYSNCKNLEGDLIIIGDDIVKLTGLNKLVSVGGGVVIAGNTSLTSLSGLNNLTSVEGDLLLEANAGLTSLSGLGKLATIGAQLRIKENPTRVRLQSDVNCGQKYLWQHNTKKRLMGASA